jgi:hypothetical protein
MLAQTQRLAAHPPRQQRHGALRARPWAKRRVITAAAAELDEIDPMTGMPIAAASMSPVAGCAIVLSTAASCLLLPVPSP